MSERWVIDVNGHPTNLRHIYKITCGDVGGGVFRLFANLSQEVATDAEDVVTLQGSWSSLADGRAAAQRLTNAIDASDYGDND